MTGMVYVYASGLLSCSVCAPSTMTAEEVAVVVNSLHPTGIDSGWRKSSDTTFASGQPNPCPCDREPERRQHWLLNC